MDLSHLLLFALGGIGAAAYAFPIYLKCCGEEGCKHGMANMIFSILVGAAFGGVVTPWIGAKAAWTVEPSPLPLALCVGLLANPLLPKIIEKGTALFNMFGFGGPKQ